MRDVSVCPFCSKMQKDFIDKKGNTQNNSMQSIIIVAFFAFIILAIVFLMQNKYSDDGTQLSAPLSEEKIVSINTQSQDKNPLVQTRREGYDLNEKPFDNENYEYDERTKDFRLVCTRPCPVSKEVLNQEFAAISYAVSTLRGLTQSDLDKNIIPFEVHASEDIRCTFNKTQYIAYMTTFTDNNGHRRGLLCFFFDKINYDRSKFPYSTSVHEVTHLFEVNKLPPSSVIWEGISEMLDSFFLKGNDKNSFCWEGNSKYTNALKFGNDSHWVGGDLFFNLCKQYGLDYDDLPELFKQLDARNGKIDEKTFVELINKIVDSDTSQLFKNAGVI